MTFRNAALWLVAFLAVLQRVLVLLYLQLVLPGMA
jgi:hypothetical protein